jgi:uncharacterized membrane protein YozB (DUF420 family)
MFDYYNKFYSFIGKPLVIVVVFSFVILILFCGYTQISNGSSEDGCNFVFMGLMHDYIKNNIIFINFSFLFFVILIVFIKKNEIKELKNRIKSILMFIKIFNNILKLNSQIFQAFRKGIIHNQVYNI